MCATRRHVRVKWKCAGHRLYIMEAIQRNLTALLAELERVQQREVAKLTVLEQDDDDYRQLIKNIWIGCILALISISLTVCMCSCITYHRFRSWKRSCKFRLFIFFLNIFLSIYILTFDWFKHWVSRIVNNVYLQWNIHRAQSDPYRHIKLTVIDNYFVINKNQQYTYTKKKLNKTTAYLGLVVNYSKWILSK